MPSGDAHEEAEHGKHQGAEMFLQVLGGGGRELPGVQYRGLFLRGEGEGAGMIIRMRLWGYIILNVFLMRNPKTVLVITSAPINH